MSLSQYKASAKAVFLFQNLNNSLFHVCYLTDKSVKNNRRLIYSGFIKTTFLNHVYLNTGLINHKQFNISYCKLNLSHDLSMNQNLITLPWKNVHTKAEIVSGNITCVASRIIKRAFDEMSGKSSGLSCQREEEGAGVGRPKSSMVKSGSLQIIQIQSWVN